MPYLPYHEPGITVLLSLTSFLLLLNVARYILDHLLYCGLIGEILLGIVYGLPVGGTSWLSLGTQETIQALGYLGLIGLVFEGGLNTDLALLKQTAYASVSVATIGLIMPIALSFILLLLPFSSNSGGLSAYPTPLAAFSAGASLCSTSLGTTFAILSSAGMQQTRVGVVLVGAAIMDDVVGLVMVNIVTTLGSGSVGGWPIARPIVASFGLFLMTMVLCPYAIKPVWVWTLNFVNLGSQLHQDENPTFLATIRRTLHGLPHTIFVLSIVVLVIYVTIASFTGASVLFAAFIAGGVVNYLWETQLQEPTLPNKGPVSMYEKYFKPIFDYMLVPFFFVSGLIMSIQFSVTI
jgi:Kef-type K+ transport system membrane component KefB